MPELASDSETELVVKSDTSLLSAGLVHLMADPRLRQCVAVAAGNRIAEFTAHTVISRITSALSQVLIINYPVIGASCLDVPVARCEHRDIAGARASMNPLWVELRSAWRPEEFRHATILGFTTVKLLRHWAITRATPRVGIAQ